MSSDGRIWHAVPAAPTGHGSASATSRPPPFESRRLHLGRLRRHRARPARVRGEQDGRIWHAVRRADGSWIGFGDVKTAAGQYPGVFTSVACAGIGQDLHVCGVSSDGRIWHAVRRADGSWIGFGDVKTAAGQYPRRLHLGRLRRHRRRPARVRGEQRRPHLARRPPRRRVMDRVRRRQYRGRSAPRRLHRRGLRPRIADLQSSGIGDMLLLTFGAPAGHTHRCRCPGDRTWRHRHDQGAWPQPGRRCEGPSGPMADFVRRVRHANACHRHQAVIGCRTNASGSERPHTADSVCRFWAYITHGRPG